MGPSSLAFWCIALGMAAFAYDTVRSKGTRGGRGLTVLLFILWMPILGGVYSITIGEHRPSWLAWQLEPGKYRVLEAKLVEGEAIYTYIDIGRSAPMAVSFAWSPRVAEKLQDAMRESRRRGARGALLDFDHSWDRGREPRFYPLPQPRALPRKDQQSPPTLDRGA
jgi:hypothetical protein